MTCSIPEPSQPVTTIPAVPSRRQVQPAGEDSAPGSTPHAAPLLADLTTIGVGGPAGELVNATSEDEILDAARHAAGNDRPLLMLGGGSNILAADSGFDGITIRDTRSSIEQIDISGCGGAQVRVSAGTSWDELVVYAISNGFMGLEALSGIPGTVGAAPVQNIGAYGQEVSQTLWSVWAYDRQRDRRVELALSELHLGYRSSVLKESIGEWGPSPRWIVLAVNFQFHLANLSSPIRYAQLAQTLGVSIGDRVPATRVREAVLELRKSKGMILDDDDRDTFSCGSFFTNPVVDAGVELPEGAPAYDAGEGRRKTSAAWLIDHAAFGKGFGADLGEGRATLSTKHTLALTNRGGATADDVVELARVVRDGVRDKFGITLVPEPVLLNLSL